MKKLIVLSAALALMFNFSCDPKAKTEQEEDVVSEQVLENDETPSQYQGSTGVEDSENNNMEAEENIELKKQDFKGSFASMKTQTYEFTVVNPQDYTFSLESENPDVQYIVTDKQGNVLVEQTSAESTVALQPGEYKVVGSLKSGQNTKVDPETSFTVHIK